MTKKRRRFLKSSAAPKPEAVADVTEAPEERAVADVTEAPEERAIAADLSEDAPVVKEAAQPVVETQGASETRPVEHQVEHQVEGQVEGQVEDQATEPAEETQPAVHVADEPVKEDDDLETEPAAQRRPAVEDAKQDEPEAEVSENERVVETQLVDDDAVERESAVEGEPIEVGDVKAQSVAERQPTVEDATQEPAAEVPETEPVLEDATQEPAAEVPETEPVLDTQPVGGDKVEPEAVDGVQGTAEPLDETRSTGEPGPVVEDRPEEPPSREIAARSVTEPEADYPVTARSPEGATDGEGVAPVAGPAARPAEGGAAWRRLFRMGQPRATKANLLVGLLAVLLGLAIATQVQLTQARGLNELSQSELIRVLDDLTVRSSRLEDQIRELEATRDRLKSGTGSSAEALEQAQKRADSLGILAGTVGATGPGITVSLNDPNRALTGPIVLDLIQELRDAGAEAIEVGGVRVVASSFIGEVDHEITVDGVRVNRPILIKAIGESKTLSSAMTIPGGIVETVRQEGATATVAEQAAVQITALHKAKDPKFAQPAE